LPDDEEVASTDSGPGPLDRGSAAVRGHEFNAEERTGQHRLVAAAMITTAAVIGIRQAWYKQVEGFVYDKTHANPKSFGVTQSKDEFQAALKWLVGIGGTWVILSLMVDLGDTGELAVALALVIMGSVVLEYGPDVFTELGISTK
jgi:hypothetical protein